MVVVDGGGQDGGAPQSRGQARVAGVGTREHHVNGNAAEFFGIERRDGHTPEVPVPIVAALTAPSGSVDGVEEVRK
ncbi:hypothetical protein [Methanopyrus sp.]